MSTVPNSKPLGVAPATRPSLDIDFVGGRVGYQFRRGNGRTHGLARAAGFTGGRVPTVIDATAGLGRDAFLLASLGAHVILLERCPVVHAALLDALTKAKAANSSLAAVVERMTLIHGDARELLGRLRSDVIVVDPMHPLRGGSALVKQEMRALRSVVGADPDALELMQIALRSAGNRVVLKWPRRAAPLQGLHRPSHQILSKTVRYDVFIVHRDPWVAS